MVGNKVAKASMAAVAAAAGMAAVGEDAMAAGKRAPTPEGQRMVQPHAGHMAQPGTVQAGGKTFSTRGYNLCVEQHLNARAQMLGAEEALRGATQPPRAGGYVLEGALEEAANMVVDARHTLDRLLGTEAAITPGNIGAACHKLAELEQVKQVIGRMSDAELGNARVKYDRCMAEVAQLEATARTLQLKVGDPRFEAAMQKLNELGLVKRGVVTEIDRQEACAAQVTREGR